MNAPLIRKLVWLSLAAAAGCGIQIAPHVSGPSMAPTGPGPAATRLIRYEVNCRECRVSYSASEGGGEDTARGLWSKTVRLDASGGGGVWLEATPVGEGVWVRKARIFVDGRLRAEYDGDKDPRIGETIPLSASLGMGGGDEPPLSAGALDSWDAASTIRVKKTLAQL